MARIINAVRYLIIKSMLFRYAFENRTTLLFLFMMSELNLGVSFIFSRSEGIKKSATANETERFIITTAAKSDRVTFEVSSRKNITTRAPIVVKVAASSEIPTFLFL